MKYIELKLAARVLGVTTEQVRRLCGVIGTRLVRKADELTIERNAFDALYRLLYEKDRAA